MSPYSEVMADTVAPEGALCHMQEKGCPERGMHLEILKNGLAVALCDEHRKRFMKYAGSGRYECWHWTVENPGEEPPA